MANQNMSTPFQTIAAASRTTGLSQYFIRAGCKNGTVPCIKSGQKYFVNVPQLLETLNATERRADV